MLEAIRHRCAFAVDHRDGLSACCGLGVLVDRQLRLFDLATANDQRRRGPATALCKGLMAWAQTYGARDAFLQVNAANSVAIRVYESLGFREAYRYWYRLQ